MQTNTNEKSVKNVKSTRVNFEIKIFSQKMADGWLDE